MIHEHRADVPGSIPSEGSPPGPARGGWVPPLTAHHFLSCFPAWRLPQGPPGRLIPITNGTRPLSRPLVVPPGTCSLKSWTSPSSTGSLDTRPSSPCHTSTEKGKRQPGLSQSGQGGRAQPCPPGSWGWCAFPWQADAQRGSLVRPAGSLASPWNPPTLHCPAPLSHTAPFPDLSQ